MTVPRVGTNRLGKPRQDCIELVLYMCQARHATSASIVLPVDVRSVTL